MTGNRNPLSSAGKAALFCLYNAHPEEPSLSTANEGLTPLCVHSHYPIKSQAFLKVTEGPKGCVTDWDVSIPWELPGTWLVPFLLQLFILVGVHIMKRDSEKETTRTQWMQLFIWKAPQTHTIALFCLIFNIHKHNCIYFSSQYWKQVIICNITAFISKEYKHNSSHSLLKEVNATEEVGLPRQEMHTIIFPHENILILLLSISFCTCINDFWKTDLLEASILIVPNYMH